MPTKPTYDTFTARGRGGIRSFLRNLKEGVPTKPPADINIVSLKGDAPAVGKLLGCKFALRTIDGEMWVCRLKPEDAK